MAQGRIGLQPATGFKPVNARHHDIEKDQVRILLAGRFNGLVAIFSLDHVEIFGRKPGLEQAPVRLDIIDDQDACTHGPTPNLETCERFR